MTAPHTEAVEYYDYWLEMPGWKRAWCVGAFHLVMWLPLGWTNWLLSWAGAYAQREVIHPEIGL